MPDARTVITRSAAALTIAAGAFAAGRAASPSSPRGAGFQPASPSASAFSPGDAGVPPAFVWSDVTSPPGVPRTVVTYILDESTGATLSLRTPYPQDQAAHLLGLPVRGWLEGLWPVCVPLEGDANRDGVVDFDDITSVNANWGNVCEPGEWGGTAP